MKTVTELFFDPAITGHFFVKPVQWYGRQVANIFKDPLPKKGATLEIIARAISFIAMMVFSCSLFVLVPAAAVGLAIKYFMQPSSTARGDPVPPAKPSSNPGPNTELSQASGPGSSVLPAFTPADEQTIAAAQQVADRLKILYETLKDLSGKEAEELFAGVRHFKNTYEKYRNPDQLVVDGMTKIFNIVDEIAANTSGMLQALSLWNNFYAQAADLQGVMAIPKDGNCWLHTSLRGLHHIQHPRASEYNYITLRGPVVDWMIEHYAADETLQGYVADAIEAYKAVLKRHLETEIGSLSAVLMGDAIPLEELGDGPKQLERYRKALADLPSFTVADYFANMRNLGSHGSSAELYAISRMFEVNIAVWRDVPAWREIPRRLTKEYDPQIVYPGVDHTINAVLTQEGNHFNYRLPQADI